jgi:8-oxo-dGTP pyrophosphatase MutT (NUDIX family)
MALSGGALRRLFGAVPDYARTAWFGLVSPRVAERGPLEVVQGVVLGPAGVLLAVRSELRGWELPGGAPRPGEGDAAALAREILEETGVGVEVLGLSGEYVRTGFRPHRARVFRCRPVGGAARPSAETVLVRWFDPRALPDTIFPWFRGPLEDALRGGGPPVHRAEHQGLAAVWAGLRIDLAMRLGGSSS